jgi:hypothetical protein
LVSSILGNDLIGLLGGLRKANTATHRVTHSLASHLNPKAMGRMGPKLDLHQMGPQRNGPKKMGPNSNLRRALRNRA